MPTRTRILAALAASLALAACSSASEGDAATAEPDAVADSSASKPVEFTVRTLFDRAGPWPRSGDPSRYIYFPTAESFLHPDFSKNPDGAFVVDLARYDRQDESISIVHQGLCQWPDWLFFGYFAFPYDATLMLPLVGCDANPEFRTVAWLDAATGEVGEPLFSDVHVVQRMASWQDAVCGLRRVAPDYDYRVTCRYKHSPSEIAFDIEGLWVWEILGDRLLYGGNDTALTIVPAPGAEPVQTEVVGVPWVIEYAPQVDTYYVFVDAGDQRAQIVAVRPDGTSTTVAPTFPVAGTLSLTGAGKLVVSADGRFLFYARRGHESWELVVRDAIGNDEWVVSDDLYSFWRPYGSAATDEKFPEMYLVAFQTKAESSECYAPAFVYDPTLRETIDLGTQLRKFEPNASGPVVGMDPNTYLRPDALFTVVEDDLVNYGDMCLSETTYRVVRSDLRSGASQTIAEFVPHLGHLPVIAPDGRSMLLFKPRGVAPEDDWLPSIRLYGDLEGWDLSDPSSPTSEVLLEHARRPSWGGNGCYLVPTRPDLTDETFTVVEVCAD